MKIRQLVCILLLSVVAIAACGDDDEGDEGQPCESPRMVYDCLVEWTCEGREEVWEGRFEREEEEESPDLCDELTVQAWESCGSPINTSACFCNGVASC